MVDEYDDFEDYDGEDAYDDDDAALGDLEDFDLWDIEDQEVLLALSAVEMLANYDCEGLDDDEEFTLSDLEDMVENGEMTEEFAFYVEESARNVVKLTKESKRHALERRAVMMLAKKANYPAYKKYKKHRDLMKGYEKDCIKAFGGSKAKSFARKMISNSKKKSRGGKKAVKHMANTLKSGAALHGGRISKASKGNAGNRFNVKRG